MNVHKIHITRRRPSNRKFDSVEWSVAEGRHRQSPLTERALLFILLNRHSSGCSYLLYNGSIFSCFLRFDILLASATLKNCGATSTNHFGSIAVTVWQYSRVVRSSS